MLIRVPIWKKAPFLKMLVPLIAGIILQWQFQFSKEFSWIIFSVSIVMLLLSSSLPQFIRFKLKMMSGITVTFIFVSFGGLLVWYKDIRNDPAWFHHQYREKNIVVARLKENPIEKKNSYKAVATVSAISDGNETIRTRGDVVIYFQKGSSVASLGEGSQVLFSNHLQEIQNAGNPGGFDYKRYALFQGITCQVFLKPGEFILLYEKRKSFLATMLHSIREKTLSILRKNIPGDKEAGLAEALLIGYKNDLDQELVQSYTNTGVVHIIAISGLHLGLIYWLLVQSLRPLLKRKTLKWLNPVLIIAGLWLFSLVAGAQASVVRSAVMFTGVVLGETLSRRTSIYNSLACSAFILLCYDPFWLWDVGFQLSYAAVLSIVIFLQPIYNLFYIKNKTLDLFWKLNAVSLAAQLLTTPLSLYHFHQFPNFFLLTNFVAVPLSSAIVLGEIFLCVISFPPLLASLAGKILAWLIGLMNSYIERIEGLPGSLWEGLQVSIPQTILLVIIVSGFAYWLLEKRKVGFWVGTFSFLTFIFLRSMSFYQSDHQNKLIVYNLPRYSAIDIFSGRKYFYLGDTSLPSDNFIRNFHLKPSRVLHRTGAAGQLDGLSRLGNFFHYQRKNLFIINGNLKIMASGPKQVIDLLIISKNPRLHLPALFKKFEVRQVVFDGSVPAWKVRYWEKDCFNFHIPFFDVREKGAFVMNLD